MQMKISLTISYKQRHMDFNLSITQAVEYHPLIHALRSVTAGLATGIHNKFFLVANLDAKSNFLYLLNSSV